MNRMIRIKRTFAQNKNMSLEMIKTSCTFESKTNPRGTDFEGPSFDDLVASVREKGVIVPVLARKNGKAYEVIAGNRRLRAAKIAGLDEIPANVVEMSDVEAREAQIIENLQRADIHPLMEGEAYRQLIEKSSPKYTIEDVGAKVGKSEKYVRQRLGLTNLTKKSAKAFLEGKINDGQAVLISKLADEKGQNEALQQAVDYGYTTKRLAEWITDRTYKQMGSKPWAKDAKLSEILGDTKKESLFGDNTDVEDPVELARKMAAFIEIKVREFAEKGTSLLKLSNDYGTPPKGIVGRDSFKTVGNKNECEHVKQGIVVEGHHMGQILNVCMDKKCETHNATHSPYKQTPKEKEKRKKEIEAEKKKKIKDAEDVEAGLKKLSWPLSEKHLDFLLDLVIEDASHDRKQGLCKRREIDVVKGKEEWSGKDYVGAIKQTAKGMKPKEKMGLIVELMIWSYSPHTSDRAAKLKKL